jgi:hypothetical protein
MMTKETYNGWSNYETWRVNLEIFDGMTLEDMNTVEVDPYQLKDYLQEYAEEIVFLDSHIGSKTPSSLVEDYARAFLSDVNWYEIAQHLNNDHIEENQE